MVDPGRPTTPGWTEAFTGGGNPCTVSTNAAKSVTASFTGVVVTPVVDPKPEDPKPETPPVTPVPLQGGVEPAPPLGGGTPAHGPLGRSGSPGHFSAASCASRTSGE